MTNRRFGYGRVSTLDQNTDSQKDALLKAGVHSIFVDNYSGTKLDRPELSKVMSMLREGDVLVITRLDRLARSTKDLFELTSKLDVLGVQLEVLEQHIDTSTPEGRLFFTLMAGFAEFEHSLMVARTKDGLAAARARGRIGGRKSKLSTIQIREIRKIYGQQELTVEQIAEMFGVSRPTIYRCLKSGD